MNSELATWSSAFLVMYVLLMMGLGWLGMKRVRGGDDFATARDSYRPLFLACALAATTASGATFVGIPGLAYAEGLSSLWYMFLYPVAVYIGMLISMRVVGRAGARFGSRTIPEFLGDRYQSPTLRVSASLLSLLLVFYLAGQLGAGLALFSQLMGVGPLAGLSITTAVLLLYVTLGGAHADILTDGVQGALMLLLSLAVVVLFMTGAGVGGGGVTRVLERLAAQDPQLLDVVPQGDDAPQRWWNYASIFLAHIPLGMLPHIGNKLWAVRGGDEGRRRLIQFSFAFGLLLPAIGVSGMLARIVVGGALLPNETNLAITTLFTTLFPPWLAALLGVGVLSAVMSTADGLVVSSSQVFANDLYRRGLAQRWGAPRTEAQVERVAVSISRIATVAILLVAFVIAYGSQGTNVIFTMWIGLGGLMSAIGGPLVVGVIWRGATRMGALASFWGGATVFWLLYSGLLVSPTSASVLGVWIGRQRENPFSCTAGAELVGVVILVLVSRLTAPLSSDQINRVFE